MKLPRVDLSDLVILAAAGLVIYGAALVYQPAGYIVGGIFVGAIGIRLARGTHGPSGR